MSALLTAVGNLISACVGGTVGDVIYDPVWSSSPETGHAVSWLGSFVHTLTSSDILLVGIAVGLVGLGVGVISRFTRLHS